MDEKNIEKERIELTRNTKGYFWKITILEINPKRLQEIDGDMLRKFIQ